MSHKSNFFLSGLVLTKARGSLVWMQFTCFVTSIFEIIRSGKQLLSQLTVSPTTIHWDYNTSCTISRLLQLKHTPVALILLPTHLLYTRISISNHFMTHWSFELKILFLNISTHPLPGVQRLLLRGQNRAADISQVLCRCPNKTLYLNR